MNKKKNTFQQTERSPFWQTLPATARCRSELRDKFGSLKMISQAFLFNVVFFSYYQLGWPYIFYLFASSVCVISLIAKRYFYEWPKSKKRRKEVWYGSIMRCPTTFWNFILGPRIIKYILTPICFYIKEFSHASDNDLSHQNTRNIKINICSTCAYFFFQEKAIQLFHLGTISIIV